MYINYFPPGIAQGKAFFNRKEELQRMIHNIKASKHTLLVSPRRYGKSSLAKQAIRAMDIPFAEIDFFVAIDEKSVEFQILNGVKQLIQVVSDTPEQWFNVLRHFFESLGKKWTIGIYGLKLELAPLKQEEVPVNILDALNALEHILTKKRKKAVLFIDEFQEISELKNAKAIEGAIRHFAQESKQLTFIFSGSNRNLLSKMFSDRSKPLYMLCDRIRLEKIKKEEYALRLKQISLETWGAPLLSEAFEKIIELTECHPCYVNILCDRVWLNAEQVAPSALDVQRNWDEYVYEQRSDTRKELIGMGNAQLKMMIAIALGKDRELSSTANQMELRLTSSAISQALASLEEKDYIEKYEEGNYGIINPLLKASLQKYYQDYFFS